MFFDELSQISDIATRTSCAVFVVPPDTKPDLKFALTLTPGNDKKTNIIGVEELRNFIALTNNKETQERFFIIAPADAMNETAQNAFLKTLEEPKPHCHFVLLTEHPEALLPTILSRTQIYWLRHQNSLSEAPQADAKTIALAKRLISISTAELPSLATELSKAKPQPRAVALQATATAVELLYKSYFKTKNPKFLTKIHNFIALYDALSQNGHIKLQIVANLL